MLLFLLLYSKIVHYHPSNANHAYFDDYAASVIDEFLEDGVDNIEFGYALDSNGRGHYILDLYLTDDKRRAALATSRGKEHGLCPVVVRVRVHVPKHIRALLLEAPHLVDNAMMELPSVVLDAGVLDLRFHVESRLLIWTHYESHDAKRVQWFTNVPVVVE